MSRNLKELIRQMTLEEKAGLCSGADFWNTMGIERLGIPSVMMSDCLRKQDVAIYLKIQDFSEERKSEK